MTYVLGWKTENEVFLAADTALTTTVASPTLDMERSSFGEDHYVDHEKKVVGTEYSILM